MEKELVNGVIILPVTGLWTSLRHFKSVQTKLCPVSVDQPTSDCENISVDHLPKLVTLMNVFVFLPADVLLHHTHFFF